MIEIDILLIIYKYTWMQDYINSSKVTHVYKKNGGFLVTSILFIKIKNLHGTIGLEWMP